MSNRNSKRRQRNQRKKRRRGRMLPAEVVNKTHRQRGKWAGLRRVILKRYHRLRPKSDS